MKYAVEQERKSIAHIQHLYGHLLVAQLVVAFQTNAQVFPGRVCVLWTWTCTARHRGSPEIL